MDIVSNQEKLCVRFVCRNGERVNFPVRFASLSDLVREANIEEEIPVNTIDAAVLRQVLAFSEAHEYAEESISYTFPFVSDRLADHIDAKSFAFIESIQLPSDSQESKLRQLIRLLETSFYIGFAKLKKILNIALQIQFYCGPDPDEQLAFKERWELEKYHLTLTATEYVLRKFHPIAQAQTSSLRGRLESIVTRYAEQHRQQQQSQQQQQLQQ